MTFQWLKQTNATRLILFFNGWGMDHTPVQFLEIGKECDLLMGYDYRNLQADERLSPALSRYAEIVVIAWSMGVWAYSQLQPNQFENVARAIAVNGTCQPIHERYGIAPDIYRATAEQFSARGREKFLKRMCGTSELYQRFTTYFPARSLDEQREELLAIQSLAAMNRPHDAAFDAVIIGSRDKIIPTQHQIDFWKDKIAYTLIDSPHFPFFQWKRWEEILNYVTKYP